MPGALLIDGIGTWLAAVMDEAGMWADQERRAQVGGDPAEVVQRRIDELVGAWRQTPGARGGGER